MNIWIYWNIHTIINTNVFSDIHLCPKVNLNICCCPHLCFCWGQWKTGKSQSEGCQQSQRQLFHTVRSSESTFKISTKDFQHQIFCCFSFTISPTLSFSEEITQTSTLTGVILNTTYNRNIIFVTMTMTIKFRHIN